MATPRNSPESRRPAFPTAIAAAIPVILRVSKSKGGAREIAMLQQELQATREYLQSVIEQQEAANEELETSKEEIQSSNEELATVNDELQNRNRELGQANNDFVNLLSSIQLEMVMLGPDLRIRRFTPHAEKALNLIATDVGRPLTDLKLPIEIPDLPQVLAEVIDTVSTWSDEIRDTRGRWHTVRIRPYRTLENRIEGAVLVVVDVHDLKTSQEQHKRLSEMLAQAREPIMVWEWDGTLSYWNRGCELVYGYSVADALAELRVQAEELRESDKNRTDFLLTLAHELRNPLTALRNAAQVVNMPGADAAKLTHTSELMARQIRNMARMIDDLLDVVKIARGEVELRRTPLDLRSVIENVVESARSKLEARGQQLSIALVEHAVWMDGDAGRLEQVFDNLLGNAIQFTNPGGRIWITLEVDAQERAVVRMRDDGVGIVPAILPRVFDLFVQAQRQPDQEPGGLGLGLTLVHRVVELHGAPRRPAPGSARAASSSSACRRSRPEGPRGGGAV